MMPFRSKSTLEERAEEVANDAFHEAMPLMNRAERRTAKGRLVVANAETAALRAEVEFLKSELSMQQGNQP